MSTLIGCERLHKVGIDNAVKYGTQGVYLQEFWDLV